MNIQECFRKGLIRISPKLFICLRYRRTFGFFPNLKEPKRFTEKMIYRIVYNKDERFTRLSDKVKVREWLKEELGEAEANKLFPETYGIYQRVDDIDFNRLPDSFVLKSNHASGHVILCTNKKDFDIEEAKKTMRKWLKTNYYYEHGEYQYKNIKPLIICEELLDSEIVDYRFFCFKGHISFIRATIHDTNSPTGMSVGEYTETWDPLDIRFGADDNIVKMDKPMNLDKMNKLAKKLSSTFNFVRVDLYNVNHKVYFAEMTFTPCGGGYKILPEAFDYQLGDLFELKVEVK